MIIGKLGKLYKVVYADPPWQYNDSGNPPSGTDRHYKTMPITDICAMPIRRIIAADATLFLWCTWPFLRESFDVIESWGFKYKTVAFCWIKSSSKGNLVSNLGRWTMSGMELCLLATKGKPQRIAKDVKQLVFNERTYHSRKPPEVRRRIVELMGDVPRLELFARPDNQIRLDGSTAFDGWDIWGNEVESTEVLQFT